MVANQLLITIDKVEETDPEAFIRYWKNLYDYKNGQLYDDHISVKEFDSSSIRKLYKWKNGMNLSIKKQTSIEEKLIGRLETINKLRFHFDEDLFRSTFTDVSPIWRIFLRHIISPGMFPIFDQHVYRAYKFIIGGGIIEIPNNRAKELAYTKEYLPFYKRLRGSAASCTDKETDEALWAFGKFLSRYSNIFLSPSNRNHG